jgi:hypothetical protein
MLLLRRGTRGARSCCRAMLEGVMGNLSHLSHPTGLSSSPSSPVNQMTLSRAKEGQKSFGRGTEWSCVEHLTLA